MLRPSWQLSLSVGVVLLLVALGGRVVEHRAARRAGSGTVPRAARTVAGFATQFAVVMALLALWQRVGALVHTRRDGAVDRARAIAALQRELGLPDEAALQGWVLPHPVAVAFLDRYYAYAHLNGTAVFLVWLWWRHRAHFGRVRTALALTTLACLLVQIVPVAPPRLLPDLGFVDTALVNGRSVYGTFDAGLANQLSAMPSVHVAWAVVVGWTVWRVSPSRWRVLGPLHTAVTVLAVVLTANHWWLDGLVAAGLFALAVPASVGLHAAARRLPRRLGHRARPPAPARPGG